MRISHEAIYQALFIESRGALKRELILCLRTGRALRMPRARSKRVPWAHVTADVLISERPAEAEDRAIRSEEHTSELQSLMRTSYAVFCWKKKNNIKQDIKQTTPTTTSQQN